MARQKPEWHAEALRIAEADPTLGTTDIARILGRPRTTVWNALNPGYARVVDAQSLQGDQMRRRTRYRGRCQECGLPMGAGTLGRSVRCTDCEKKRRRRIHERTLRKVERWYNAGLTYQEMARRAGWAHRAVATYYVRILAKQGRVQLRRGS